MRLGKLFNKMQVVEPYRCCFIDNFPLRDNMASSNSLLCFSLNFPGTRQSYGDPQNLTDMVREILKDKKTIADETTDKTTNEPPTENVKERSKI